MSEHREKIENLGQNEKFIFPEVEKYESYAGLNFIVVGKCLGKDCIKVKVDFSDSNSSDNFVSEEDLCLPCGTFVTLAELTVTIIPGVNKQFGDAINELNF